MTPIEIQLDSNAADIARDLERFPPAMMAALVAAFDRENELTVSEIVARKLSRRGPKTLGVVTNRLRQSIRRTYAVATADSVDSSIGSNVKYAGVHEFGFRGRVSVPAHQRKNPQLDIFRHGGATIFGWQRTSEHARAKRLASGVSRVRAHSRLMNMPERAYIRSTIGERSPRYTAAVSSAIISAWSSSS